MTRRRLPRPCLDCGKQQPRDGRTAETQPSASTMAATTNAGPGLYVRHLAPAGYVAKVTAPVTPGKPITCSQEVHKVR